MRPADHLVRSQGAGASYAITRLSYACCLMGRGSRLGTIGACLLAGALALVACGRSSKHGNSSTATTGGEGTSAGANAGGQGGAPTTVSCEPDAQLSPSRVLLLSDRQFRNAVRDLFGVDVLLTAAAPDAEGSTWPGALEEASVHTVELAKQYHLAAGQVAGQLEPCGKAAVDAECMRQFLSDTLERAWRRPVEPEELASIMSLFDAGLKVSPKAAVSVAVRAVLESGSFLYRTELGAAARADAGAVTLTPYELAAAIGFTFLDSVPDDELWAKAVDGSLTDPDVLAAEADRLLALPAVRDNLRKKVSSYLGLEELRRAHTKDVLVFPDYSEEVQSGLYEGSQLFLDELLWHGNFSELFTTRRLYANEAVAAFYGIPNVRGAAYAALDFDGDERRAGLLSQPAFLAATNLRRNSEDISHRGAFVLNAFLCPPTLPPAHATSDTVLGPGSVQQEWRNLNENVTCSSCHGLFDPFGFAMEKYDAVGRYRTVDETGVPIDASATIRDVGPDFDGAVADINEVAAKLSQGRRAADCAAIRLTSYALDHLLSPEHLPCALTPLQNELATSGSFSELFKALVTSPAFLTREAP